MAVIRFTVATPEGDSWEYQWTNATQPTDPTPAGYTVTDKDGNVIEQRPLNDVETERLANQDEIDALMQKREDSHQNIQALLEQQEAFTAQIEQDVTLFKNTQPGSTLTQEHLDAFCRMVNGFGTAMQAITDHITINGIGGNS